MNIPQFMSLEGFTKRQTKSDFMAALVVTAIAIPESLGFAAIIGLPLETGLYCALLAPIVFALLTSSKHLIVGADSATAALVASGAATIAARGTDGYVSAVTLLTFIVGLLLVVLSAARFGFLADLISKPVFIGFLAGIGLQLMVAKLPDMLGLDIQGSAVVVFREVVQSLSAVDWPTALFAVLSLLLIFVANRRKLPGPLLALVGGIVVMLSFPKLHDTIATIPAVNGGFPMLGLPDFNFDNIVLLVPATIAIVIVIIAQSSAVIRNSASRFNEKIDDNRDLNALGFGNIASSLTGGFAINGSPPRTIASEMSGGRTQMVNIFMAIMVAAILLFFTDSLQYVPVATLGAIVFSIGLHLFNVSQLRAIWQARRAEWAVAMIALVSVVLFGVQYGVLIAVAMSIVERLRRQYRPSDEFMLYDGKLAEWAEQRLAKHHKHRSSPPGLMIYRFGGSLFFENTSYFSRRITTAIENAKEPVKYVIVDAGSINDIDYTAAETIRNLHQTLNAQDIQLGFAHVSPHLLYLMKRHSLTEIIGKRHLYPSLESAVFDVPTSKRSTVEMVQRLKLPISEYVVIGGGVLDALSIRETNDVDLVVSSKVYKQFKQKGWKEYIQDDGKKIISHNGYQLMQTYVGYSLSDLKQRSFVHKDVSFMGLEDLLTCKRKIGRQKDLEDIRYIEQYLLAQGSNQKMHSSVK
ncbi:MAG: SulP family inorganic anion transporter [Candidatus Saccharimonadales bacterium]